MFALSPDYFYAPLDVGPPDATDAFSGHLSLIEVVGDALHEAGAIPVVIFHDDNYGAGGRSEEFGNLDRDGVGGIPRLPDPAHIDVCAGVVRLKAVIHNNPLDGDGLTPHIEPTQG